jgi:ABC-type nitrate/sulfonate/bicarbonate transport system substrate-binding protein
MIRFAVWFSALLAAALVSCAPPPTAAPSTPAPAPQTAAASGTAAPPPPAPLAVRVTTPSESTSTLPLVVAQRLGYYAEEAIDLETLPMRPNVGMAALLSGEVQYSSAATSALSAAATGAPLRVVLWLADRPSHALVGALGMTSPDELRGGTIATSSPGGVQYREAQAAVRHFGLDPRTVTLVALANDAVRQAALESGAAQATVLTLPFNFKLERQGYPRLLNFAEGDLVRLPVGGLASTLEYLAHDARSPRSNAVGLRSNAVGLRSNAVGLRSDDDGAAVRMVRATLRGLLATRENRAASVSALEEFYDLDEATAGALYDGVVASYSVDGHIAASAIRAALETADEAARQADPATLVDYRYLDRATRTLNRR